MSALTACPCAGLAPTSTEGVYVSEGGYAREQLQAQLGRRPGHKGHLGPSSKLVYHTLAMCAPAGRLCVLCSLPRSALWSRLEELWTA